MQRTVLQTLLPELTSPYAQQQAAMLVADLAQITSSLERLPAYDAAEVADLTETLAALKPLAARLPTNIRSRSDAARAEESAAAQRRAMEAVMAELASALALRKLDDAIATRVRAYLRRHLDRLRTLLPTPWGA